MTAFAIRCAVEIDDAGTLCEHLRGACPDHPVCGIEEPLTQSARCLRLTCNGNHCADGTDPWAETEETT